MPNLSALTVYEPWATLIAIGAKPYEFRGHCAAPAYHGRRIAIHASVRPVKRPEVADLIVRLQGSESWSTCLKPDLALPFLERLHANPRALPLGQIVATAILGVPVSGPSVVPEFGGVLNDSDRGHHANWAWPMLDVVALEPPVPMKGAQGFWPTFLTDDQIGRTA